LPEIVKSTANNVLADIAEPHMETSHFRFAQNSKTENTTAASQIQHSILFLKMMIDLRKKLHVDFRRGMHSLLAEDPHIKASLSIFE
jgi:hypothetical protein